MANLISRAGVAALATLAVAASAQAQQDYPNKRITLIVANPPGNIVDGTARIYADKLKDLLGQPVIVENRAGAGGLIGHEAIAKSAPDGYTFGLVTNTLWTPRQFIPTATFDPIRDYTPLGRFAASYYAVVAQTSVPAKNLKEFVAYAKANPGKLNVGIVPNSMMQIDAIRFAQSTAVQMVDVPFNGGAPLITALMGDQVQVAFLGATVLAQIKAGKLNALAYAGPKRWALLPDVPTAAEQGVPFEAGYWFGFAGPGGLPPAISARLSKEILAASKTQQVNDGITKTWNMEALEPNPADMAAALKREIEMANAAAKLIPAPKP